MLGDAKEQSLRSSSSYNLCRSDLGREKQVRGMSIPTVTRVLHDIFADILSTHCAQQARTIMAEMAVMLSPVSILRVLAQRRLTMLGMHLHKQPISKVCLE